MPIEGLDKNEESPKWRLVLGERKHVILPIVSQAMLMGTQN